MGWTDTECKSKRQVARRARCASCRWWFDGTCRKRSPLLVSGLIPGGHGHVGVWPETPANSWCGDFAFSVQDS